jgi:hypothetical protein
MWLLHDLFADLVFIIVYIEPHNIISVGHERSDAPVAAGEHTLNNFLLRFFNCSLVQFLR